MVDFPASYVCLPEGNFYSKKRKKKQTTNAVENPFITPHTPAPGYFQPAVNHHRSIPSNSSIDGKCPLFTFTALTFHDPWGGPRRGCEKKTPGEFFRWSSRLGKTWVFQKTKKRQLLKWITPSAVMSHCVTGEFRATICVPEPQNGKRW